MKQVLVVGGGAAGMMAAAVAAEYGARAFLLEKQSRVGMKLSITGKGRCNLTSAEEERQRFIAGYARNGQFLFTALNAFSNLDLIRFFQEHGLDCKVERGQRVFPQSDRASDVVRVLYKNLEQLGVDVNKSQGVKALLFQDGKAIGVQTQKGKVLADAVIIATGGMSYPRTGSTGDGYRWAATAGHHIIEPRPGLVPLVVEESWVRELQGLSLRNVRAIAWSSKGKKINEDFGEMLFTHFGVSGPIILSMSRDIGEELLRQEKVRLVLDLKPALNEETLDQRLQRDLALYSRRQFRNSLDDLLPRKLIPLMVRLSGIDPQKESNQVSRQERKNLLQLLKEFELTVLATRPIDEAIVTAGGVDVKEVDPRTMQSRLVKALFFAGEILDIDGYTGGFNLQAAFSTGYLAGKNAALLYG
ncbi:NAD(P)/FAD-dependent oxidoreductase [Syntrophomonas wolfei]|uniref:NAD(P)/FAD-dependent oxidoreductase n=1 Tax=Syntrophomonas wolfei subsp. wolfei (strain DSM 2245B / Goettingen) TaxID=335541 RepID=Q0AV28_SYNWW|nr:NAD(P)/FAD-dependent oxidoreductase [Syntrophomonas wolfei]ABI69426.1 conserved hypothetical protein [Syntrophomonas wolfei subsp. wolfei str. Goettingen G311]